MSKSRSMQSASRLIVALAVVCLLAIGVAAVLKYADNGGCSGGIDCTPAKTSY